jgi:hypothetical protein
MVQCRAWCPSGTAFVPNPWYSTGTIRTEPKVKLIDSGLLLAAELGDWTKLRECINIGSPLSVIRDCYGAGALHFAVMSGSIEAVKLLLDAGAYINISDWRMANPLYYACTRLPLEKKEEMIKFLVVHGADTMQISTFSGERPWERLDSQKLKALVIESSFHKKFVNLRGTINDIKASNEAKQLVDLCWRSRTAHWAIQPGRSHANQNFNPMPGLITTEQAEDIEFVFKDCQHRHVQWLASMLNK